MAWSIVQKGGPGKIPTWRKFICDTIDDIATLPVIPSLPAGCECYCSEDGNIYVLETDGDWVVKSTGGGGSGGGSLSTLSDVDISNPTDGEGLMYDNGKWVNGNQLPTPSESNVGKVVGVESIPHPGETGETIAQQQSITLTDSRAEVTTTDNWQTLFVDGAIVFATIDETQYQWTVSDNDGVLQCGLSDQTLGFYIDFFSGHLMLFVESGGTHTISLVASTFSYEYGLVEQKHLPNVTEEDLGKFLGVTEIFDTIGVIVPEQDIELTNGVGTPVNVNTEYFVNGAPYREIVIYPSDMAGSYYDTIYEEDGILYTDLFRFENGVVTIDIGDDTYNGVITISLATGTPRVGWDKTNGILICQLTTSGDDWFCPYAPSFLEQFSTSGGVVIGKHSDQIYTYSISGSFQQRTATFSRTELYANLNTMGYTAIVFSSPNTAGTYSHKEYDLSSLLTTGQ